MVVVAGFSVQAPVAEASLFFSSVPAASQFGLALVFVLLTFGGWNEAAYISAELRGGTRSIVRVIVIIIGRIHVVTLNGVIIRQRLARGFFGVFIAQRPEDEL